MKSKARAPKGTAGTAGTTGTERTVSASELKNDWHAYLESVREGREEIIVTWYGKPVARLAPVGSVPSRGRGIFGALAGSVTILGDIVAPTGERWDADG